MSEDYVRYADWLTISWMGLIGGLFFGLFGAYSAFTADPSVPADAYPIVEASAKAIAIAPPAFVMIVGLQIAIQAARLRDGVDQIRPEGLEVPS